MDHEESERSVDLYLGHLHNKSGFIKQAAMPSEEELSHLTRSTYILTDDGFSYYDYEKKDLVPIITDRFPGQLQEFKEQINDSISNPTDILSRGQLNKIFELTNHKPDERAWKPYPHRENANNGVLTRPDALEVLNQTGKNIKDAVKPYKSGYHVLRDLAAPLRSAYQLATGALSVALAAPIAIISGVVGLIYPGKGKTRVQNLKETGHMLGQRIAEGLSKIFFGVNLAVTSAFMPLRIITRGAITVATKIATPDSLLLENNAGMDKLIKQANRSNSAEMLNALGVDIHRKYQKALKRGQATNVAPKDEEEQFKKVNKQASLNIYNKSA